MRVFIILCLAAVTCASHLGYNYNPNEDPTFLADQTNNVLFDISQEALLQQTQTPQSPSTPAAPTFEKQFFSFSAPEESFNDDGDSEKILSTLKKNLRVIFIRTPENKGLQEAALNLIKQSAEDHTAIYVLAKQTDFGGLAQQLQTVKAESETSPEVHFVKYRTSQDAVNAQRAIQNEYNTLPGNSRSVNGGQATVLDFTPKASSTLAAAPVVAAEQKQPQQQQYLPTKPTARKDYLPSAVRRRFRL